MVRETKSKIKNGEEMGEDFWTAKEVRHGYPLSLLLFNFLVADLEEEMRKVKWKGMRREKSTREKSIYDDIRG